MNAESLSETQEDRFGSVIDCAQMVFEDKTTIAQLTDLSELIYKEKAIIQHWWGEQSREYKLSNALLNVIRLAKRSTGESKGMQLTVNEWIEQRPIRKEWITKLKQILENKVE